MLEKLAQLEAKYDELTEKLSDPEIIADPQQFQKIAKAHADLEEIVTVYREYRSVLEGIAEAKELLEDKLEPEFRAMVQEELSQLEAKEPGLVQKLRVLLLPKDPNDEKSVIVEIRAGTGGEEAALFAADLFRMYSRYAEAKQWRVELMSSNQTELGGFKEVIFSVEGRGAYSRLKYESGVHRVQRIPTTESGGRIHTSAATVAVLPEVEEVEVEINPDDLRIDVFRSSGHGGQSVNTTDSAVRITHLPTGLVVSCQDEKSQHKNKDKAMKILRARLYDMKKAEQERELAAQRRSQVGTGDRSERIRTYNFPQGRVTDHRIGLTLYRLNAVLEGDLDEIVDGLITADQTERLQAMES
ncbi:MAG: peptide chain release factor 1 [Limnochordia bacterium]|nr:peptide chain release factor 1 [Bacillota bacterium]HOB08900.1 peptide chain release factor 1 [Limnochordia bacterium]NLH31427.1 peptide chain release factor 1 [Bacillota bacterium]HPT93116.1 peptide chain release factor 1 [Limnochordia bacterium]HPZ31010.1 peptide chain release factor 1 [Limnochordia bacterium]